MLSNEQAHGYHEQGFYSPGRVMARTEQVAGDGGYASGENVKQAKAKGVKRCSLAYLAQLSCRFDDNYDDRLNG